MNAIERHRKIWEGKSDEWIFERLDLELKEKVEAIHRILSENESIKSGVIEVLEVLDGKGSPNMEWIKNRLSEVI